MQLECPSCNNSTDEVITHYTPGKLYTKQKCCKNCIKVADIITNHYPYSQDWYKLDFSIFQFILPTTQLSVELKDQTLFGEDASEYIKNIHEIIINKLNDLFNDMSSLDIITYFSKIYHDITILMLDPKVLEEMYISKIAVLNSSINILEQNAELNNNDGKLNIQKISTFDLISYLDILRNNIIYLQQMAIHYGKYKSECTKISVELLTQMMSFTNQIVLLETYQDSLYYFSECSGISIKNNRIIAIDSNGKHFSVKLKKNVGEYFKDYLEQYSSDLNYAEKTKKEFYEIPFLLNDILSDKLGFSALELFHCYINIASLAEKWSGGTLVLRPSEFHDFLCNILQTKDTVKINVLKNYLIYKENSNMPLSYKIEHLYSPAFYVPIDKYGLIVINDKIVDFARINSFYDLTYGTHELIINDGRMRKEYYKIKQNNITGPFEKQVAKIFSFYGWDIRINVEGGILVDNKMVAIVPKNVGEIDIIAINPEKTKIVVIDCKYLFDYGAIGKEVRNVLAKFINKEKSYISQIKRKTDWVNNNIDAFKQVFGCPENNHINVDPMIVTNNIFPYEINTDVLIVGTYELSDYIGKSNTKVNKKSNICNNSN